MRPCPGRPGGRAGVRRTEQCVYSTLQLEVYRSRVILANMSASDLITFLQNRAGEYLRGVIRYDQETTDVLYLRDAFGNSVFKVSSIE